MKTNFKHSISQILKLTIICLVFWGCGESNKKAADGTTTSEFQDEIPKMVFDEKDKNFDFGEMPEGKVVEHKFNFKNEGEFPLIINNVTASCGCTTPEWPRDPIAPGESNHILVRFNSKGKSGPQSKTITVYANTSPAQNFIEFKAIVLADTTNKKP